MAYGTIKVDNITFDNGGVDKLITVSGLFYSTSGALTVTGAISGGSVTAPTATFTTLTGTTTAGTTATFTSGSFTSLTGVTTTVTSGIFSLGSAAAPSITISGDLNTGIYSPGADQLAISTNGTQRLLADSAGGVTVPTRFIIGQANNVGGLSETTRTTPGIFNTSRLLDGGTNPYLQTGAEAGIVYFNADGSSLPATVFRTGGTERLRLTSTGALNFVGAGTAGVTQAVSFNGSAPVNSLVIDSSGNVGVTDSSPATNSIGAGAPTVVLRGSSGAQPTRSAGLCFISQDGTSKTLQYHDGGIFYTQSITATAQVWFTNNTERLRLTSTGALNFVGAGTAGSTQAVSFNGSAPVNSLVIDSLGKVALGTSTLDSSALLFVNSPSTAILDNSSPLFNQTNPAFIQIKNNTDDIADPEAGIIFQPRNTQNGAVAVYAKRTGSFTSDLLFRFRTGSASSAEVARFTSTGRVGIGTGATSPTAILHAVSAESGILGTNIPGNIYIESSTTAAAGVGGGIVFGGAQSGTVTTVAAGIKAAKSNGTAGDYSFDLVFYTRENLTAGAERMRISSVGTTTHTSAASTAPFIAKIGTTEVTRIDSSGRLLVGTSSAGSTLTKTVELANAGTGTSQPCYQVYSYPGTDAINCGYFHFYKSRGATVGTNTIVASGDTLGQIYWHGANGTSYDIAASIKAEVDGAPSAFNDMPGRLVFSTTADGAASPTERLRITNDGVQCYNQPTPATYAAAATLTVADLKTAIITYTGAAATLTLPTGTLTEGGFAGIYTNMTFEWSVINTGAGLCTIGAGTGHTIIGGTTIAAGTSGRFASRRTAANTFVSYRLS